MKKSNTPPRVVKRNGGFFNRANTTPGNDFNGGLSGLPYTSSVELLPLWSCDTLVCLTCSAATKGRHDCDVLREENLPSHQNIISV